VRQTDSLKQNVVTTFFFNSTSSGPAAADWQALAVAVSAILYNNAGSAPANWLFYGGRGGITKVYDMKAPKPRPEVGYQAYVPTTWDSQPLGPREVALCLSYYGTRNLARQRGRVYLGPWSTTYTVERPASILRQSMLSLGKALIGPIHAGAINDWALSVWSRVSAQEWPVTNLWVNDVWDVHRERGMPETARDKYP
jgi:hypothetical protein